MLVNCRVEPFALFQGVENPAFLDNPAGSNDAAKNVHCTLAVWRYDVSRPAADFVFDFTSELCNNLKKK